MQKRKLTESNGKKGRLARKRNVQERISTERVKEKTAAPRQTRTKKEKKHGRC